MQDFNNDVNKMLEMLKKEADKQANREEIAPQTTKNSSHSDDEIKDMLKKQFSAEDNNEITVQGDDYSFYSVDFFNTGSMPTGELTAESETEVEVEEAIEVEGAIKIEESVETTVEEVIEEVEAEIEAVESNIELEDKVITDELADVDDAVECVIEEEQEATEDAVEEIILSSSDDDATRPFVPFEKEAPEEEIIEEETVEEASQEAEEIVETEEPIAEESINYDEVLEGQQGTVFNQFVEDFTGDLDDVVFEAEITDSHAPNKQYTIFEDWEQLMKDKLYETAEEEIIPPTKEELAYSAEIQARAAKGNTDYFNPVVTDTQLDAVDIALMVALGGESELNQTVGFEKIRQAVHEADEQSASGLEDKKVYGYCGEEYSTLVQNGKIREKYNKDKTQIIWQLVGTAIFALVLLCYEIAGWVGIELPGIFNAIQYPHIHVLCGLQFLFVCIAISFNKIIKLSKNLFGFSSISYIGALVTSIVCIVYDVLILTVGYSDVGATLHTIPAFLLLLSLIYDAFDVSQQAGVFNIVANSEKKLVLEPYGKLRMSEDEGTGDIIDKDSYCISRVPSVSKYFARTAKPLSNFTDKLVSLIISFSVALCVMLVLLLMNKSFEITILSFILTLSFALICASIFESEFAFFVVYKALIRYKTGIIGKPSIAEYGKCNIVYFDDYNVFNKKSVRTKGLKLYDNNEIYRILYHTQAVFSKIGGPLKGVFEFATSEMVHSKSVEIKEISKEGIAAKVDGRTSVLIGTGSFMKSRGIHPSYTSADLKLEERGEESIMFIALNGTLGAKLYVTYQFSSEFEKLARKLSARGVGIGIRSSDPNVNNKWARKYGEAKRFDISIVRPTLKEIKPHEKSIEGGVVSVKNVRALTEALMMCIKLDTFESLISKIRTASIVFVGILSFALVLFSGINAVSILALTLCVALCASIMMLLTYFHIKR